MLIKRTSFVSAKRREIDIPITEAQLKRWQSGIPIQRAAPQLTADQREFLMTGCTADEYEELTKLDDE